MNYRVTIGMVAAVVVLAALVFGLDRFNIGPTAASQANATATSAASAQAPIFNFADSKVTALELHQADKTVRGQKSGDSWTLADSGEPANRSSFNSLIVRLSQLKATRQVDNPGTDLKQYGLDAPRDSAVAELDDGTRNELLIGSKTPVQTGTYAKRGDTPDVYVISDQLVSDIERLVGDPKEPPTPTPRPASPVPGATSDTGAGEEGTPTP